MAFSISSGGDRKDISIRVNAQSDATKTIKGVQTYTGKTATFMNFIGKAAIIDSGEGQSKVCVNKRSFAKKILMEEGMSEKNITDLHKDTLALKLFAKNDPSMEDLKPTILLVKKAQRLLVKEDLRPSAQEDLGPSAQEDLGPSAQEDLGPSAQEDLSPAVKEENSLPKAFRGLPKKLLGIQFKEADIESIKLAVKDKARRDQFLLYDPKKKLTAGEIQDIINWEIRMVMQHKLDPGDKLNTALDKLQEEIAEDPKQIRQEILDGYKDTNLTLSDLAEKEIEARAQPYEDLMQAKIKDLASSSDFKNLLNELSPTIQENNGSS